MVYTIRFFLQNAVCFIILTYLVLKLKKNNSDAKRLVEATYVVTDFPSNAILKLEGYFHSFYYHLDLEERNTHSYKNFTKKYGMKNN